MAVLASPFRRRYTPQTVRFASDPEHRPWPSAKRARAPAQDDLAFSVVEVEVETDVEDATGEIQFVTVKSDALDAVDTAAIKPEARAPPARHAYTGSPLRLLIHDVVHIARLAAAVPSFVWPLRPAGLLSELAPTLANAWCMAVHAAVAAVQASFLLLVLPAACLLLPAWLCAVLVAACVAGNQLACRVLLNGWRGDAVVHSRAACAAPQPAHAGEQWIFVNGIGTGRHWLQSSIDRLACTFQRPVMGIHNTTSGLVFDMIECLVQRNLNYATRDVRATYAVLKDTLCRADVHTVVLVLHSQGGIVGSMALDWLLQELPHALVAKLEVYTFGNAANHFHSAAPRARSVPVVEHYAHTTDVVARWGVLHYTSSAAPAPTKPFAGRVFARASPRGGHQFCQHYLDGMFPLERDATSGAVVCADTSEFMESGVESSGTAAHKVKDVSRLWQYRNGACPL